MKTCFTVEWNEWLHSGNDIFKTTGERAEVKCGGQTIVFAETQEEAMKKWKLMFPFSTATSIKPHLLSANSE